MQLDLHPARLVLINETWASTNMARRYGRAPRGERLRAAIPRGHWKTTTSVARLRLEGVVAPLVFEGPINAQVFEAWVEQFLAPTLHPADVVVMDNLSSHKGPQVRAQIEAAGATLSYPPPYSSDFNPIAMMFSKLKAPSARPSSARSKPCGAPSPIAFLSSRHANAPTISRPPDMNQLEREPP